MDGAELDVVMGKLWKDWQALKGKARQTARDRWLSAIRGGMYQMMQVCCEIYQDLKLFSLPFPFYITLSV